MKLIRLALGLLMVGVATAQTTVTVNSQTRRLQATVPYMIYPSQAFRMDDINASHQLTFTNGSNLTGHRTFTLLPGDADLTLDFSSAATGDLLYYSGTAWSSFATTSNVRSILAAADYAAIRTLLGVGTGDVTASVAFGTDNRMLRSDGTGKGAQSTGITVDDSNNITGVNSITVNSFTFTSVTGTVPDGNIASTIARDSEVTAAVAAVTGGNLSQFASTTSAQMRTLISDEQGTGPLQFNVMTTGGDIIIGGASGAPTRLANGSNGQVLTSAGGTTAPTWTTIAAGGNVTNNATLTSGNITIGGGTSVVGTTNISVTGGNNIANVGNLTASGTLTVVTLNATTINAGGITGLILGANGGTGVDNTGKTITLGGNLTTSGIVTISGNISATGNITTAGNLTTSGANALTFTTTATSNATIPAGTTTLASLAGAETLTNKLVGGVEAVVSASAIDFATASTFTKTLSANTTFTFSNVPANRPVQVAITNTASNYTATWPSVLWVGSSAPTLTTGANTDRYEFEKINGAIYGRVLGQNYALSTIPVITSLLTASGTEGVALTTYNITGTNSPTSYSASGLPSGLSVNTGTGAITGTPAAAGVSNITIGAINASGTGTDTLVLTVAAAGGGPTLIASDNFDAYADSSSVGAQSGWAVVNDTLNVYKTGSDGATGGGPSSMARSTATFSANQRSVATCELLTPGSFGFVVVGVRCQSGADTRYFFQSDGTNWFLLARVAGTQTIITTGTHSLTSGARIALDVTGSSTATRLTAQVYTGGAWSNVTGVVSLDPGTLGGTGISGIYIDGGTPGIGGDGSNLDAKGDEWEGWNL